MLDHLDEIALTSVVVDRVIALRFELGIKLPDAIIGASALVEGLPLMTRNIDDFRRIPGLQLVDPFAA
ncbi:hypothetical protein GPA19_20425 [Azoarcus indigens]|uniref:PIN domain-containing protein n=1 Tax=Azoarcus indigens TaxID=29545 RepID=A0A4R6DPK1_9RHOO|nr:hypothetical protein [Azoarcus indigens]NMG67312.1 hypothetical protein [Azoarcus indigens]TDN46946.1 hypothetical protein C7389_12319 [Azoarcus indigens]